MSAFDHCKFRAKKFPADTQKEKEKKNVMYSQSQNKFLQICIHLSVCSLNYVICKWREWYWQKKKKSADPKFLMENSTENNKKTQSVNICS